MDHFLLCINLHYPVLPAGMGSMYLLPCDSAPGQCKATPLRATSFSASIYTEQCFLVWGVCTCCPVTVLQANNLQTTSFSASIYTRGPQPRGCKTSPCPVCRRVLKAALKEVRWASREMTSSLPACLASQLFCLLTVIGRQYSYCACAGFPALECGMLRMSYRWGEAAREYM